MFVDASAVVAILLQEPAGEKLAAALEAAPSRRITNVVAVWEIVAALSRKKAMPIEVAQAHVANFLVAADVETLDIATSDLPLALAAFDRCGRHRHPQAVDRNKGFNLADCFHYACARAHSVPILTTDEGFALTDPPKVP